MKRALLAATLLLAGCSAPVPPASVAPSGPPVSVEVQRVERRDITRQVELPAEVAPWQQALIYAKVAGYLRTVRVDKGDVVRAGELLATLEAPELLRDVAQTQAGAHSAAASEAAATAQVANARAQLAASEAGRRRAEALTRQARAELRTAQAQLALNRTTLGRLREVYHCDPGLMALQDLDVARAQVAESEARVAAARDAVMSAQRGEEVAASQRQAAGDNLAAVASQSRSKAFDTKSSEQVASRARDLQAYTEIRAPFPGIVTMRFLDPGTLAQSAATDAQQTQPVLALSDIDTVRVQVHVPEDEAPFVHRGTAAEVHPQALPGQTFAGRVSRTTDALDPATRTMLTEIDLRNPKGVLQPGMYVQVRLGLETHRHVLALPSAAILADKDRRSVFVVQSGAARQVPIQVGFEDGTWTEVTHGLQGTESVVLKGQDHLTPGAPVSVR